MRHRARRIDGGNPEGGLASGTAYACSTYRYRGPAACSNGIVVPRVSAERGMLAAPTTQLLPHLDAQGTRRRGVRGHADPHRTAQGRHGDRRPRGRDCDRLAAGARLAQATAAQGKVRETMPGLDRRIRDALSDLQRLAQRRNTQSGPRARDALRAFYGGRVRVSAEMRDVQRVPVALANVPAFALLPVAGGSRVNENFDSGGPLWRLFVTLATQIESSKRLGVVARPNSGGPLPTLSRL